MGFPCTDHIIVRTILLEHSPHRFNVVSRISPISSRVQVSEIQHVLHFVSDPGDRAGDLSGYEGFAAPGRLMVEKNSTGGVQAITFAVVYSDLVSKYLGAGIGAADETQCTHSAAEACYRTSRSMKLGSN